MFSENSEDLEDCEEFKTEKQKKPKRSKIFDFCCPCLSKYHDHKRFSGDELNEGEYIIEKLAIRRVLVQYFIEKEKPPKSKKIKPVNDEEEKEKNKKKKTKEKKESKKEKKDKKTNKTSKKAKELLTSEEPKNTVNILITGRPYYKKTAKSTKPAVEEKKLKVLYYKEDQTLAQQTPEKKTATQRQNRDVIKSADQPNSDSKPAKLNWKIVVKHHKDK